MNCTRTLHNHDLDRPINMSRCGPNFNFYVQIDTMQTLNNLQRVVQWYSYYLRTLWSLVRISAGALFCQLQLTIVKCRKWA
jgi:hypothetical protein